MPKRARKNYIKQIKLASWNVRTLSDVTTSKRQAPERRTALVAAELGRLDIDLACLSECRIPEEGEFIDGSYTFLHYGKSKDQPKQEGVAIVLKTTLRSSVVSWKGINSRIMRMQIKLAKSCHATVIRIYAPTFKRPIEERTAFYDQLSDVLASVPRNDRLFLLGDFNARVGSNCETWSDIIGQHGLGQENDQGIMLLELCARFGLTITNTIFSHQDIHKGTWMHPRSKRWHMIDYVIVRQHYKADLTDARDAVLIVGLTIGWCVRGESYDSTSPPNGTNTQVLDASMSPV